MRAMVCLEEQQDRSLLKSNGTKCGIVFPHTGCVAEGQPSSLDMKMKFKNQGMTLTFQDLQFCLLGDAISMNSAAVGLGKGKSLPEIWGTPLEDGLS